MSHISPVFNTASGMKQSERNKQKQEKEIAWHAPVTAPREEDAALSVTKFNETRMTT